MSHPPTFNTTTLPRRLGARAMRQAIVAGASLLTGVRALWGEGNGPSATQTVYFANHNSHADFVLLWASLPPDLRTLTRPVAGEDYWNHSSVRRFVGHDVFNALMIRRVSPSAMSPPESQASQVDDDPVAQMGEALQAGDSLIIFPEGTRNTTDAVLLPLKSGIHHLSQAFPQVRFVPVWIENLKRVLPKGALLPVPLSCSVRFGAPLTICPQEDKTAFLQRARQALLDLQPAYDRAPADSSPEVTP
ncbi:lysophospholipid acyltransferase family protein [Ottowia sp.]|uniref:lysophospholipid acyltransferase family protein n=1 Tax=Ottowia sp. TaxID=1898956 RepID=UPI003A87A260